MWKKLRLAVVWLMVLATPTQGFAAATMLYCGPGHHSSAGLAEAPAHSGQAGDVAAATAEHHDHNKHVHENRDAATPGAAAEQLSAAGVLDQSAKMKCSVCAACCNAALIVSSAAVTPPPAASSAPVATGPALPISFITDGPSRPPRTLLV